MRTNKFTKINGEGFKFGIVRARFNERITQGLLEGALEVLKEAGVRDEDVSIIEVPGSYEIPVVAARLARFGNCDCVLALGCIIKGDTSHDQYLASAVFNSLSAISVETGVPVTVGILTVNNLEQAEVRSGSTDMNRGKESAYTALEMAEWKCSQVTV